MQNFLMNTFQFAPIVPHQARGSRVVTKDGVEYIDFSGGIAVNALGHCHPDLIDALTVQAQKLWHCSNLYTTEPAQQLAQKLVRHSFADCVFLSNSGAEANEAALKLARKAARDRFGNDKFQIISCVNSFHGRTLFTVSVGGQAKYSHDFAPLPEGICHIPFNDSAALKAIVSDKTCAVIIEPIQGESGVLPATEDFLHTARECCSRHHAALILDEVQTGIGHTGTLFAYEQYGIEPDILSSAKALGCGIPIGATLAKNEFAQYFTVGSHGSTFGGNPLACAVASRALDIITRDETLNHVCTQGEKLQAALRSIGRHVFSQVRGKGLLIGCVLNDNFAHCAAHFVTLAREEKLMLLQAGTNVVRLAPALNLTDEDLTEGLARFEQAVQRFIQSKSTGSLC